jgi:plasmid replication initiation protein
MSEKNTPSRSPLLPDRHPIKDFFICDVMDAIPKDDMGSMEHPIFSLSTKPDRNVRYYDHNGVKVTVTPSVKGLATIHDKDIPIYCISQLIAKANAGLPLHKTLHLKAHDLLVATNRNTDGKGYKQLEAALERLSGTRIKTNLKTNEVSIKEGFGLINAWRIVRYVDSERMAEIAIDLSDWIFNAVLGREVLTLHREYFRLRKPLERRIYELGRKHCGKQDEWAISLELLKKKSGSCSAEPEFRRLVGTIAKEDELHSHMPDYALSFDGDTLRYLNRQTMKTRPAPETFVYPTLDAETYNDARTVAPGYDVYHLEEQWREFWVESGRPELKSPDAAFIGFCKRRHAVAPMNRDGDHD